MHAIEIAQNAGACYGVERALKIVEERIGSEDPIFTLGPLIHNPLVVADLKGRGVEVQEDVSCIPVPATVVIRSHGVVLPVIDAALKRGLNVVDATCPHVMKAHNAAAALAGDGFQVLVIGEPGHPEVEGILSRAGDDAHVVDSVESLQGFTLRKRVGVVVQTTQTEKLLQQIVSALLSRVSELRVHNTICAATTQRQKAACELAQRAGCMIVVGGKNSGNTRRLAQVCLECCPNTHHIECPDEIDESWFDGVDLVGITAGASTPASHISAVYRRIGEIACL